MLHPLNHHSSPLLNSLQYAHVSLLLGSPALDPAFQVWPHHCGVEGKDPLLWPGGNSPPNSAQDTKRFFDTRAHCWLMFNMVSTRTSSSFSAKLLSSWSAPSICWCMGLFLARCRTLHFSLLNFMRFLSANFSSLQRSLWMAAWPSGTSATPLSLVSSADLPRVHSAPSSR